jgi:hypothetical protein
MCKISRSVLEGGVSTVRSTHERPERRAQEGIDTKRRRRNPVARREHISAENFNKWWLLPIGILTASALTALSIIEKASNTAIDCSGPSANDYSCYQKRYQDLVYNSGVEAAFADLKDKSTKEEFVRSNCHQLTHVIGRAAADLYGGEIASTYSRGDNFCGSGYYHGAIESVMATLGADKVLDEADNICADLREQNRYLNYRNCAHGLGHGFMGLYQNELFESLEACGALSKEFERDQCSGGVFMQNINDDDNPSNPSKYLKADQPFYPCTEVKSEYTTQCYSRHTTYALKVQGNDFSKVFDLCGKEVEDRFQTFCYYGLGFNAAEQSTKSNTTEEAHAEFIRELCMLGQDDVARARCLAGAVRQLIFVYDSDVQAKALCESLKGARWRAACLQASEKYMAERRG